MKKDINLIKKPIRVTSEEMKNIFAKEDKETFLKGVLFANVVYFVNESGSIVRQGKKQLQKLVKTQITIGSDYEARINRDLAKQGEDANFTAQGMSGQTRINKYVSQSDKSGKFNLVAIVEHHVTPKTHYFHDDMLISKDKATELGLFMPSYFADKKTSGRGNMSEERDFNYITIGFENIKSVRMGGVKYLIEN